LAEAKHPVPQDEFEVRLNLRSDMGDPFRSRGGAKLRPPLSMRFGKKSAFLPARTIIARPVEAEAAIMEAAE
jgi:hypothetical protein